MEFPELGKHCSHPSCGMLDFLPVICKACRKPFCVDHAGYREHHCQEWVALPFAVPSCPLCGQMVNCARNEDPNAKVDLHIRNGCPKEATHLDALYRCACCGASEVVEIRCPDCCKLFCVRHRLGVHHSCEPTPQSPAAIRLRQQQQQLQQQQQRAAQQQQQQQQRVSAATSAPVIPTPSAVTNAVSQPAQSAAVASAAANRSSNNAAHPDMRVQLIRLKQRAQGNSRVPLENRFYLDVLFPRSCRTKSKPLFFDKSATIGKVLDEASAAVGIDNINNRTPDPSRRLNIFLPNGVLLPTNIPLELLGAEFPNGSQVVLSVGLTLQTELCAYHNLAPPVAAC
eukprot:gnl/Spiro4/13617_TR7258_c0_g1_i1.p1 gnl/Spiro4/13617_TR7258_c0_g1~~gnl/Spiro4/13617_TR7258_c0_g1_i1.p1  ORF type:complete len:341 (+),score=70.75 gnl/Spiro4/13617_TR7258_c0_g1_i1:121-1143(+)